MKVESMTFDKYLEYNCPGKIVVITVEGKYANMIKTAVANHSPGSKLNFLNECLIWLEKNELYEQCEIVFNEKKKIKK